MRFHVAWILLILTVPASAQTGTKDLGTASQAGTQFGTPCSYPDSALAAHAEGSTMVSYTGTDDGRVADVKVIQSSGRADLDGAAVQCVGNWRFDAAADKYDIGQHRANIAWSIPQTSAGSQANQPQGIRVGLPHVCMQDYPAAERKAGIGGTTTIDFTITPEGHVRDPHVAETSGNADLDAASLRCVMYWLYRPTLKNGKPVSQSWTAKIEWRPTNIVVVPSNQPIETIGLVEKWGPIAVPPRERVVKPSATGKPHICDDYYPPGPTTAQGVTTVHFYITKEGDVTYATVEKLSGIEVLDRAALVCVSSWKFDPVVLHGWHVVVWAAARILWWPGMAADRAPGRDLYTSNNPAEIPPRSIGKAHLCLEYYPKEAMQSGIQGETSLAFRITTEGTTEDVNVTRSSGNQALDEAAVTCAKKWLYAPATENGKPIETPWRASVDWLLKMTAG